METCHICGKLHYERSMKFIMVEGKEELVCVWCSVDYEEDN